MDTLHMNKINRAFINRLKIKGVDWLRTNIEQEEQNLNPNLNENETPIILYIKALKKALSELEFSE